MAYFDPYFDSNYFVAGITNQSGPFIGRNARFYINNVYIAFAKNLAIKVSVELLKEYSLDLADPIIVAAGKQTVGWSCDRLYTVDEPWLTMLKTGAVFTVSFAQDGIYTNSLMTLNNAFISDFEVYASESGAILQRISGEATSITPY